MTMQAAILAGGLGTRLRPLTFEIPKPMVCVKGQPFLEHQINWLVDLGYDDIVLLIGYLGSAIAGHFGDGSRWGITINYSSDESLLGTAGALKKAEAQLGEAFLLLNGDTYLPIDYRQMEDRFEERETVGLVAVYGDPTTSGMNNIKFSESGIVTHYDKTKSVGMTHIDAGAYMFSREILERIPEDKKSSLEQSVFSELIANEQLVAYPVDQRFYDIGTPDRLKLLERILR